MRICGPKAPRAVAGVALLLAAGMTPAALSQTLPSPYIIRTVAGGSSIPIDGQPAATARLSYPRAVAVDAVGSLYIVDGGGIRKIVEGTIKTISSASAINVAVDLAGNVYYATQTGIHRIDQSGKDTAIASGTFGRSTITPGAAVPDIGLTVDLQGNVYYTDYPHNAVRMIAADGADRLVVSVTGPISVAIAPGGTLYVSSTRIGGSDISSVKDGKLTPILPIGFSFVPWQPTAIAVDSRGRLYAADYNVACIRRIDPVTSYMTSVAGACSGQSGFGGDGGSAADALLNYPSGIAFDAAGNIYVADQGNGRIRRIDTSGDIATVAGVGNLGTGTETATSVTLQFPNGVAVDATGNLYIAETGAHVVRMVSTDGKIGAIAGTGACGVKFQRLRATESPLCSPTGVALDAAGNLYIADSGSRRVMKVDAAGMMTTIAGTARDPASDGSVADEKPAIEANLQAVRGVAVDAAGRVYFADAARIRVVTPDGILHTFAGTGKFGSAGDGGPATAAQFWLPHHLALDASGALYISDGSDRRIRKVSSGIVTTVVDTGRLGATEGIAVDTAGTIFFTLVGKSVLLRSDPSGLITTIAGGDVAGFAGDGDLASRALLNQPRGLAIGRSGTIYVADWLNARVRALIPNPPTQLTRVSGDGQTGIAGTVLPMPLKVAVQFAMSPMAGIPVAFAIVSGTGALSSATALTDASGTAEVSLTLGPAAGPVTVTATVEGLPPVTFRLNATEDPRPSIAAGGVFGAAAGSPPVRALSPGGLATVIGRKLADPGVSRSVQESDLRDGVLPASLGGSCVEVDGAPAFLLYVSETQINFQVPPSNAASASIQVVANCGTTRALKSNVERVAIQTAAPEFLYWTGAANGKSPVVAVNAVTGEYIGAPGLLPGAAFVPARPGDILTVYGISFGATVPDVPPGKGAPGPAPLRAPYSVTLGGVPVAGADVLYVGATPGSAGLYQLNLRVALDAPRGDLPLVLTVGAYQTAAGAYLTVGN